MGGDAPSFNASDDGLHRPSSDFYDTETFWYSFFVPERRMGGWLYTSLRSQPGVCAGGAWIWDDRSVDPWSIPFFEQFSWLRYPSEADPARLRFPTGMTIEVLQPLMSYDLVYTDRDRLEVELRFDALEAPVALRSGSPPYPKAHHFDQTGHVTGIVRLDGEEIVVDCYAMRDRSWGRRTERGYPRVGYVWAASPETSFLAYSVPDRTEDRAHSGYLRSGSVLSYLRRGARQTERDPVTGWVTSMTIDAADEQGRALHAEGVALSRMVLPGSTSICINTLMRWDIGGATIWGEDQDVWPIKDYRNQYPKFVVT
ncbi:MAG: hypothetical protein KGQ66_12625 [Acidobacteriota bacterium]|nr:hypothetical protein [Acidobacteriota bacterium]